MKFTFLIGNGFDRNLGLNTNYGDFIKVYKKSKIEDTETIKYFKEKILYEEELWSNAELAFGKVTENFKKDGFDAEAFCDCHEDFCNGLASYLRGEEQRINYTDNGTELAKSMANGLLGYKKAFREDERNQIEDTEKTISDSLQFNFINFNYTATLDLCLNAVKKNPSLLGKRNNSNSYPYNTIGTVLHVHGTLDRDMVLGVNDISQISDCSLFDEFDDEYICQIIKQKTNEINGENIDIKAWKLLQDSDFIYIYGMSIGDTDKLWWNRICKSMNDHKRKHLFIHKYNAPQEGLIRRKMVSYIKKEKKHFTAYSSLNDESKEAIEKRIHIDTSNIFEGLKNIALSNLNT